MTTGSRRSLSLRVGRENPYVRLEYAFEWFHDVCLKTDDEIAALIRDSEIDVPWTSWATRENAEAGSWRAGPLPFR
jgi:hypothetical protein